MTNHHSKMSGYRARSTNSPWMRSFRGSPGGRVLKAPLRIVPKSAPPEERRAPAVDPLLSTVGRRTLAVITVVWAVLAVAAMFAAIGFLSSPGAG